MPDRLAEGCYIDGCTNLATLFVESYPDDVWLCDDHKDLYDPQPWDGPVFFDPKVTSVEAQD